MRVPINSGVNRCDAAALFSATSSHAGMLMRSTRIIVATIALLVFSLADAAIAGPLQQWLGKRQDETAAAGGDGSKRISLPAGATVLRDLAYGGDPRQIIDVYLPPRPKDAPVLFFVHGGAWFLGDKKAVGVVQNKIDHWLPKGFIFVSVDYPMLPQRDALGQADEVARALAFAQARAGSWGGDSTKFILMGHSAGAHLVALLAAAPAKAYGFGAKPWLGTVSLDSAALDVAQIMDGRHLPFYDRAFGNDRNRWRLASPIDALSAGAAPILAVCSLPRPDHSCDHAVQFAAKAKTLGVRCRVSQQDLSHAQINEELGLPGAYTDDVDAFLATLDPSIAMALQR